MILATLAAAAVGVAAPTRSDAAISFTKKTLAGTSLDSPTSLQFGPDDRLYVAQQNGAIKAFTISRNAQGNYSVTATELINQVKNIPNHNDDGQPNSGINERLCTGLLVAGTAQTPVIYVTSSDPRIGGGEDGSDKNLDTNSGILSRLTKNGSGWTKLDLVRGLPRSEENHNSNGLAMNLAGNTIYIAQGGNTNMGAPSNNFARLPEYALSAAILEVDLDQIGNSTYDLPTLNDEDRSGTNDLNDPFGGNNGKNQAKLVSGGPVQVYAPGFRNPYDVVVTRAGRMYSIDNGPNGGWGDVPAGEGGNCTNAIQEPGLGQWDNLHYIPSRGYYGGHPNPTRARTANTFNSSNPQSPVSSGNSVECDYRAPGSGDGALVTFKRSTDGITEYTASNFDDAMDGDLLAASFDNQIWRIQLNSSGTQTTSVTPLFSSVGADPLDVTAQGDSGEFPGTIWVADHELGTIIVYEPADLATCSGNDNANLDEDDDGFDNADEIDNGTDPCSQADYPADADGDFWSDLNDIDDDNDGILDTDDAFALDADNGTQTSVPLLYGWENDDPALGGLLDLGFTGLMTNGVDDYAHLFNADEMTAGGAAGVLTVERVTDGDARGNLDSQKSAFQLGVPVPIDVDVMSFHTTVVAPFLGITPEPEQSLGLFVGNGDQDNYFKVVASAGTDGEGAVETLLEVGGTVTPGASDVVFMPGPSAVDLYIVVDRAARTAQAGYSLTSDGVRGPISPLGEPFDIPAGWLTNASRGLAVGIISTSRGAAPAFAATWDLIEVTTGRAFCTDPAECDVDGDGLVGDDDPCLFETRNLCFGPPAEDRTQQLPIRLNANVSSAECSGEKTDCNGDVWAADFGYNHPENSSVCNLDGGGENCVITGIAEIFGCEDEPTEDIFQCSHTDPSSAPELIYDFDVPDGQYVVNLYFANTFTSTAARGSRVFDINVEGKVAYRNFDQVDAAGGSGRAVVRSVVADVSDGNGLQVELEHGTENPTIKAIEVLRDKNVTTTTTTTSTTTTSTSTTTVTSTSTTLATTTTTLSSALCGDGDGDGSIDAIDALVVLRTAVGLGQCSTCVCDVDESGAVAATDALAVLRAAVGSSVALDCITCS